MRDALRRISVASIVIVCAGVIVAGQERWYQSYQEGVKAFNSGDYKTAEQKLLAAMNARDAPRERARKVLYYGQIRDEFFPEYYLAMTYAKLGQWANAKKYAADAEKYLKSGDAEFPRLEAARADAERELNSPKVADNVPGPVGPAPRPVNGPADGGTTTDRDAAARSEFDRRLADANRFRSAGQYAEARQSANAAKATGIDSSRADDALKNIDIQDLQSQIDTQLHARTWSAVAPLVDRLARLDPANTRINTARQETARGLAVDEGKRLEREGLTAFYRGDYQRALDTLGKVAVDVKTPRATFYMACSTAALGLLKDDKSKLRRAHELFLQAQPKDNPFTVDRKYVSPSIMRVLDSPAS